MTKTQELQFGMARKWERHFPGRYRICARWLVAVGVVVMLINTLVWSQFYFPLTFNSILAFELIVDLRDAVAGDWTYSR